MSAVRVALTSYYNKTFVDRSQRSRDNFEKWFVTQLKARGVDKTDARITDMRLGAVYDPEGHYPRYYTMLGKEFIGFEAGRYTFFFNPQKRIEWFAKQGVPDITQYEKEGMIACGTVERQVVLMDPNNVLYRLTHNGLDVLGTVPDVLEVDVQGAPIDVAEITVSNKTLTIGFVLAYYFGLSTLISGLKAEVTRHPRGERFTAGPDEYTLVFQDETLVFSKLDARSTLILAGLRRYHNTLKQFSVWDFDKHDVFYRILDDEGMGVRLARELEALRQGWVDPITKGLLEQMGEPTVFTDLLVRSVELLLTDYAPSEVDPAFMRYRGYERFAGMIYGELSRAAKTFNNRASSGELAVELKPHAVWQRIVNDPAVALVEDSNPIANLREQEGITYRGDGGRSGVSMVERTRVFHQNDVGTLSESTVDSGDVGIIAYLSPDANFTNMRGLTRPFDKSKDGASKLLSTAALLAPASEHDD